MPNTLLTGHNPAEHIVAIQQLSDTQVRLYIRTQGSVRFEDADFFPFFFLSNSTLLRAFNKKYWLKELSGDNPFRYLAVFTRWNDLWDAVRIALETYNADAPKKVGHYADADFLYLRPDPVTQYLMQSGTTLFKGMSFREVTRLQLSIATHASKGNISDSRRTEDRVLAVALCDSSGWSHLLDGRKMSEKEILKELVQIILERDPDVIEGHGLFGHDFPYLLSRYKLHSMEPGIGRDGSEPKFLASRWGPQEPESEAGTYDLAGRHLVDTLFQTETYDFSKRALESYDLQSLSQYFGLSSEKRVWVGPRELPLTWEADPKKVLQHLQDNVADIRTLSDHLSPSSFFLTQMVPMSYAAMTRTGSAAKIESLLVREYLRQKHSLPQPERGSQTTGGYSDIFMTGVFAEVVHADVESLYPSIILNRSIQPKTDELGVFLRLLSALVEMRLEAKRRMKAGKTKEQRMRLDALQASYKILINSFYGYLGYARGLFNDYRKADEVTKSGQELLRKIVRQVGLYNGQVLEVDTDGVFFIPPDNVRGEEEESALIARISGSLPEGINLVPAGRFMKMMSYKKKNYAILDAEGTLVVKGSALVSRSMERFLRRFLRLAISNLLEHNIVGLHNLYGALTQDILQHRWDALDFCRTEVIHDPFHIYEQEIADGKRNPAAAYEVARIAGLLIKPGDRISYYVTGTSANVKISENCKLAEEWDRNFADENTAYYLSRLQESAQKFEVFFAPEDFRKIFTVDDLFGFDGKGISVVSKPVAIEEEPETAINEQEEREFRIWLGDE